MRTYARRTAGSAERLGKQTQTRTSNENKTMKCANKLLAVGLMSLCLVGCATRSQVRHQTDDYNKVVKIHEVLPGKTTKTMLLEWFGPPNAAVFQSEQGDRLTWKFNSREHPDLAATSATLVVELRADGKVTRTSSSCICR